MLQVTTASHLTTPRITRPDPLPIGWGVLMTGAAWLISRLVVAARWAPARDPFTFTTSLWARWDTYNYGSITQFGRTFGSCHRPPFAALPNPSGATWCGTAGWLPGWPWMIRVAQTMGASIPDAGLVLSWAALGATVFLVWFGWCRMLHPVRALLVMVGVGVFPGAVYDFALFPTSVALAATTAAILVATRERFLIAAALMTVAGLCYPSAWFAAMGLAAAMLVGGLALGVRQAIRRGLWGIAGLSSLVILALHDQAAFGHFNAYVLVDTGPGLDATGFPGSSLARLVIGRATPEQRPLGRVAANALALQALLAVLVAVGAAVAGAWRWARSQAVDELYPGAVGLFVVVGIAILGANGGAWNRSVVLAAPCMVCLRRLPIGLLLVVVGALGVVTAVVSKSFFAGTLV